MDPERTLNLAQTQFHAKEYSLAMESILAYYDWRVRGGFEPHRGDEIAATFSAKLVDAVQNLESLAPAAL